MVANVDFNFKISEISWKTMDFMEFKDFKDFKDFIEYTFQFFGWNDFEISEIIKEFLGLQNLLAISAEYQVYKRIQEIIKTADGVSSQFFMKFAECFRLSEDRSLENSCRAVTSDITNKRKIGYLFFYCYVGSWAQFF